MENQLFLLDPGQIPPVGDKPLYHDHPTNEIGEWGYFNYLLFEKVVKLSVNHRATGENTKQIGFRDILFRLRTGDSTVEDWKDLLTRQPLQVQNLEEFEDAIRLFFANEQVANFNFKKLTQLGQPIAEIKARHSSKYAAKLPVDEFSGLEPVVHLAKGANVMLTNNLWAAVGLCNGATGTLVDFIYQNEQPPCLPVATVVHFDDYSGPQFIDSMHNCIPIFPLTVSAFIAGQVHERQQLPLRLSWAITIHKSQGLTLQKVWIDLGKSEKVAGISYVAISRVRTLDSCIIEPMSLERLQSIKKGKNITYRLQEEERLQNLANCTEI